jgi:hypothetical protein
MEHAGLRLPRGLEEGAHVSRFEGLHVSWAQRSVRHACCKARRDD